MIIDENFWKRRYSDLWNASSAKEEKLKDFIEKNTKAKLEPFGLGAKSTKFIAGNASKNNNEKGAPDFHVLKSNIYIEVTGPVSKPLKKTDKIWLRPDKLRYAYNQQFLKDEFFAVNYDLKDGWHIIHFTEELVKYIKESFKTNTDYLKISPVIRGVKENYIEIDSCTEFVHSLDYLVEYLKHIEF